MVEIVIQLFYIKSSYEMLDVINVFNKVPTKRSEGIVNPMSLHFS